MSCSVAAAPLALGLRVPTTAASLVAASSSKVAARVEQRRRVGDLAQAWWVGGIEVADDGYAGLQVGGELVFGTGQSRGKVGVGEVLVGEGGRGVAAGKLQRRTGAKARQGEQGEQAGGAAMEPGLGYPGLVAEPLASARG